MKHDNHSKKNSVHQCVSCAFASLLLWGIASNAAPAQNTTSSRSNLQARQYMSKMAAVYKSVKSYSGSVKISGQITGQPKLPTAQAAVSLQKPHFAAVRFTVRFTDGLESNFAVFDGTNLFATSSRHKNQYVKQPLSKGLGIMRVVTRAGLTGPGLAVLFEHPDMLQTFAPPSSLSLGQPTSLAGVPVVIVISKTQQGQNKLTLTYHIGKKDFLLRQMILVQTISGQMVTMTETHTNIKTNIKLPASTFTFTPTREAKPVQAFTSPR